MLLKKKIALLALAAVLSGLAGCGTQRKARMIRGRQVVAALQLPRQNDFLPEYRDPGVPHRDTLKVTDLDGREMILMKAVRVCLECIGVG